MMNITKSSIRLYASPKAVITRFLDLPGTDRTINVINRLQKLSEAEAESCLRDVLKSFAGRHRALEKIFSDHSKRIEKKFSEEVSKLPENKRMLLGAFFTKEYSIQAAALFNPSIVPHPNQQGLQHGEQRFVMSLRATGEGHISSVTFQTGIVDRLGNITLDPGEGYFTPLEKNSAKTYSKDFVEKRMGTIPGSTKHVVEKLPLVFTANEALNVLGTQFADDRGDQSVSSAIKSLAEMLDSNYDIGPSLHIPFNEKVIFPISQGESMGMEDVRLVKYQDNGDSCYYGTYTAYNGRDIKTHLIETADFDTFSIRTLYGAAISDKGMALFPEKVNGKYVMISRQGGEKINIMFSDDLYKWDNYQVLSEPRYTWELVQLGNCGSPIKTDKGWLLLTHGVGMMRTYVISAVLLDLDDPSKIIGRLDKPLIVAGEGDREGYVPNVVYTCGLLRHGELLVIPYAVSDSATGFATIVLQEIMNALTY